MQRDAFGPLRGCRIGGTRNVCVDDVMNDPQSHSTEALGFLSLSCQADFGISTTSLNIGPTELQWFPILRITSVLVTIAASLIPSQDILSQ